MDVITFEEKRRKFLPKVPRAVGKPTVYLEGYPTGDGEPMSATEFHGRQISILSTQLNDYFSGEDVLAYVGTDSFVYYQEGNKQAFIGPDIYVVLGVPPTPVRKSFYTWEEGAAPAVVFEFLSESTEKEDRGEKMRRYFLEVGIYEYFIHQPSGERPPEFRAWRRRGEGYEEILPDERGALYSEALKLWFMVKELPNKVRLMRPYLLDGTPLPTLEEAKEQAAEAEARAIEAEVRAAEAEAKIAAARAEAAEARIEAAQARTKAAEAEIRTTRAEVEAAQARIKAAEAEIRAARAEVEAAETKTLTETNTRRISELEADMTQLRAALEQISRP
ncbi:Uma2 family endonuclease [Candidatus Poribacteria bacterium]|nr:Uma2 family endonuclease [Candidatus Poribacteria bacterium]